MYYFERPKRTLQEFNSSHQNYGNMASLLGLDVGLNSKEIIKIKLCLAWFIFFNFLESFEQRESSSRVEIKSFYN